MSACCSSGTHSNRRPALDVSVHQARNTALSGQPAEGRPEGSAKKEQGYDHETLCAVPPLVRVGVGRNDSGPVEARLRGGSPRRWIGGTLSVGPTSDWFDRCRR